MIFLAKTTLQSVATCLLFISLISQSSNLLSQTNSTQAAFHFGESPCGEAFLDKSTTQTEIKRKITKRVFPKLIQGVEGSLVMAIAINRSGKVIYAEYIPDQSIVTDKQAIMSAIETISKTTFAEDPDAADSECGFWTMRFKDM